ncbi:2Fe-2S iron-sulfur cluster-binding protein [Acidihalobacter yilgarnensis]|uniref:2Fe-2S iron-sulfur cluster-binding protein n=1 Tax=Acidihalobacter yilgarnensis TaxID=2819280 RepID=UPI000A5FAE45|nr:2Fe-2S iron-sulfur cluster binding domain-containing protein [Acidihalobacter yilgarnensis]
MTDIRYAGQEHVALPSESVLETLERVGVQIPNACRSGVCQSCLMRARAGDVPPAAQAGLKDTLRSQGYFLACCCRPEGDLEVALPDDDALGETEVSLTGIELLSPSVMRVLLKPEAAFEYRRGQFINLIRDDGLRRSYSLAGCADLGDALELHVRHIPGGAMSDWLMTGHGSTDSLRIQGPHGNCFYVPGKPDQAMLLIGTGTGLAPLYGIVCDALAAGHTGPIHLYHGARTLEGLYLVERMRELSARHANLYYTPA